MYKIEVPPKTSPRSPSQRRGKDSFNERCYQVLSQIPAGKVATYKQIALAMNTPKAARAVGNACRKNPHVPIVPCHRVICSNGALGEYVLGKDQKKRLLVSEGIEISEEGFVNLELFGWNR